MEVGMVVSLFSVVVLIYFVNQNIRIKDENTELKTRLSKLEDNNSQLTTISQDNFLWFSLMLWIGTGKGTVPFNISDGVIDEFTLHQYTVNKTVVKDDKQVIWEIKRK